jgi:hypothetical protein
VVLSSDLDCVFSDFSSVVEVSSGVDGLTGFRSPGGVSNRGLVVSELDRGLALGGVPLGSPGGRGGREMILGTGGVVIGPTMTFGGTIFGAGAGM